MTLLMVGFVVVVEEVVGADSGALLNSCTLAGLTSFDLVSSCCLTAGTAIVICGEGLVA